MFSDYGCLVHDTHATFMLFFFFFQSTIPEFKLHMLSHNIQFGCIVSKLETHNMFHFQIMVFCVFCLIFNQSFNGN